MAQTLELAQTGKRDHIVALERRYQQQWQEQRAFEVNAPSKEETAGLTPAEIHQRYPKWFGCFPYPYMNGTLHLGHAFTISKIEFAAGYQRLLGKRVLFPHGFHVTGMPIRASADKLVREMELFGPDFERYEQVQAEKAKEEETAIADAKSSPNDKTKAKKGKLVAKSTGYTYQFQILESLGIPRVEIKKFADPFHWLTYFPPIAIADNNAFGSRIDWRRSLITTKANPFYDSFVRWQMNKLYRLGKIKFGERYTVYSPKDGQPCMDHDRQDGEGIGPQEYTGLKMEVVEWGENALPIVEAAKDKLAGRKIHLVAATLRPETMYGQTNCYVGPNITYGVFSATDQEAFLCTRRAARNMAFQGIITPRAEPTLLFEIDGSDIVGTRIKAPFAINPEVYVLPMENVLPTKGTGVVTSVPSDSPDDYQTLMDLRKKADFYGIKPEWAAIDPVPVLSTPTYGEMTAPVLVKQLKILSQKDTKQLAEAKEIAYKEGFYNGMMSVGEFKGQPVQDAKPRVRERMIEAGLAFAYAEPEGFVLSRSGDECVVALMDQWYLDYGEDSWRKETERLAARMEFYSSETRHAFEKTLSWFRQWACARTYGLGSHLPWDPQFLVESLSDSTIYMSYYTIAHYLHPDTLDGSKPGPLGITPDQLTDEIWEYVFSNGPFPSSSTLPKEKVDVLKHEYDYFYPFDIRSSAKDLVPNHLTMALYNHVAVLPEDKWPLSMRTNGHLMLNGEKMSKSKGNFLTLRQAVDKFGADATRLSLADAGDGLEDANFDEKTANANILRVHTLLGWCEDMVKDKEKLRHGQRNYHDDVFENEINDLINITQRNYEATNYKDALKYGFYELQSARDWYREVTADVGMHEDLILYWIRIAALLVAPIAPHFAEHICRSTLGLPTSIQNARWPTPDKEVDRTLTEATSYMRGVTKMMRDAEASLLRALSKSKGKGPATFDPKKLKSVRIYVAIEFPEWQNICVDIVKEAYNVKEDQVDDAKVKELLIQKGLIKDKRAMPFIQAFKKRMAQYGASTAFRRALPFSETQVLTEIIPYLKKTLGLVDAEVLSVVEARGRQGEAGITKTIIDTSEPGSPAIEYRNV